MHPSSHVSTSSLSLPSSSSSSSTSSTPSASASSSISTSSSSKSSSSIPSIAWVAGIASITAASLLSAQYFYLKYQLKQFQKSQIKQFGDKLKIIDKCLVDTGLKDGLMKYIEKTPHSSSNPPPSSLSSSSISASTSTSSSSFPSSYSPPPPTFSSLLILGSGSSSGVPRGSCLYDPASTCNVCKLAMKEPPHLNKHYRCNPSLLIKYWKKKEKGKEEKEKREDEKEEEEEEGEYVHIQIDCGKTFRESMLRWYSSFNCRILSSVLLTHEHADACFGLDDLRSLQAFLPNTKIVLPIDVYTNEFTYESLNTRFNYLTSAKNGFTGGGENGEGADVDAVTAASALKSARAATFNNFHDYSASSSLPIPSTSSSSSSSSISPSTSSSSSFSHLRTASTVPRAVAALQFHTLTDFQPRLIDGLEFLPIPLIHGSDYICLGFIFGREGNRVVYMSDVSEVPENTREVIEKLKKEEKGVKLLYVDCLFKKNVHPTHFNLAQALECVEWIRAERTVFVGMSDEFEQEKDNQMLEEWGKPRGLRVEFGYDGMRIDMPL